MPGRWWLLCCWLGALRFLQFGRNGLAEQAGMDLELAALGDVLVGWQIARGGAGGEQSGKQESGWQGGAHLDFQQRE